MPDEVSRTCLPNQLVIPGVWDTTSPKAFGEPPKAFGDVSETPPEVPITGQGTLFSMPSVIQADDGRREASPTQTGDAGQSLFRGACDAHALTHLQATDPAQEGFDCYVEGQRVQVKATSKLQPDGRFKFNAGSGRRFDRYRDRCDLFAFVITARDSDLYGRMLLMEAGPVINRWPGPEVGLRPADFPRRPDLTLLMPLVTDQMINELLRSGV